MKAFQPQRNFSLIVLFMVLLLLSCGGSNVTEDKKSNGNAQTIISSMILFITTKI